MVVVVAFFFFKQKTAYEMRISDWSSDVCSSDLPARECPPRPQRLARTRKAAERPRRDGARGDRRGCLCRRGAAPSGADRRPAAARATDRHGRGAQPSRKPALASPQHAAGPQACARDALPPTDRTRVESGKGVPVSVELGGRRNMKQKKQK